MRVEWGLKLSDVEGMLHFLLACSKRGLPADDATFARTVKRLFSSPYLLGLGEQEQAEREENPVQHNRGQEFHPGPQYSESGVRRWTA